MWANLVTELIISEDIIYVNWFFQFQDINSLVRRVMVLVAQQIYRVIQKEVYTFKYLFYKYYWTYGDMLYTDWRENSQSYFNTLQALDASPTCDAVDVKSTIQLFPHSSQHVTG
jgi:hypothetical protein